MTTFRTKITNLLDQHNIPYRLLPHSEPVFTIEAAAAQRGVVREEMIKLIMKAQDLIRLAGAQLAPISQEESP